MFSHYKETCEVLLDYTKIGGDNIKHYVKKAIRNLLHSNIDSHSRWLIVGFPGDGIKCISKIQSHFAKMTFADKSIDDRLFHKVTHQEGNQK